MGLVILSSPTQSLVSTAQCSIECVPRCPHDYTPPLSAPPSVALPVRITLCLLAPNLPAPPPTTCRLPSRAAHTTPLHAHYDYVLLARLSLRLCPPSVAGCGVPDVTWPLPRPLPASPRLSLLCIALPLLPARCLAPSLPMRTCLLPRYLSQPRPPGSNRMLVEPLAPAPYPCWPVAARCLVCMTRRSACRSCRS